MKRNTLRSIIRNKLGRSFEDAPLKQKTAIGLRNIKHENAKVGGETADMKIYVANIESALAKEDPILMEQAINNVEKTCDIIIRHCQMLKKAAKALESAFESEYSPR